MLLRVLALLAIAAAAARPVARLLGSSHAPTALAIVIDNSMSSAAVVNGRPLLDQFKAMARDVLSGSTSADRLWLVTIDGNVRGGSAGLLRDEVNRLEPSAGAGDPVGALNRAAIVSSRLRAGRATSGAGDRRTAQRMGRLPSIADTQLLLYTPTSRPRQSCGVARRRTAGALDAPGFRRRSLSVA